jgi:hypothetical protein
MPDEKDEPVPETETATPETQEATAPAPETVQPDPQEQRLDRIVAQRLGKYAARTQAAEQEVRELRDELMRTQGRIQQQAPPPPPKPVTYSPQQLQALVDQGQITPAIMADQLAWQRAEQGKVETLTTWNQQQRVQSALGEVNQYIGKMPALTNTGSPEFGKVARAAAEIAEEMSLPIQDPRVQRRALRETFGSLDSLTRTQGATEFNRTHADTHAESGSGGGRQTTKAPDPLAGIPKAQVDFWRSKNYSQKMMEEEAKFYRARSRGG